MVVMKTGPLWLRTKWKHSLDFVYICLYLCYQHKICTGHRTGFSVIPRLEISWNRVGSTKLAHISTLQIQPVTQLVDNQVGVFIMNNFTSYNLSHIFMLFGGRITISLLKIPCWHIDIFHVIPSLQSHFIQKYWIHSKLYYDDVIDWKLYPHYWSFARWIHWSLENSPHNAPEIGNFDIFLLLA